MDKMEDAHSAGLPTELANTIEKLLVFQSKLVGLSSIENENALFESALETLRNFFSVPYFQVLLKENASGQFNAAYTVGEETYLIEKGVLDVEILKWLMSPSSGGKATSIGKREPWLDDESVESLIIAPMQGRANPIGVLIVGVTSREDEFNSFQLNLVSTLSKQFSLVLDNLQSGKRVLEIGNLLDNILESVPHSVVATGPNDRILALNSNAEFMFGVKRFMALNERYQEVLPRKVCEMMSSIMIKALGGADIADQIMKHNLTDGTQLTLGVTASLLYDRDFKPHGMVFLFRDMTLSREVQKLRELDQLKSEFVQMVSHELKTPLTTITGGLELMNMDIDQLSDEHKEIIGIITSGGNRLRALIMDLLDLSRLEKGDKISLNIGRVELDELIKKSIEVSRRGGDHEIVVNIPSSLPVLFLDKEKMKQVFDNIIGNAVKYSPNGGKVEISASLDGEFVRVKVTDQGLGIPPEHLPYIFDKFYRGEASGLGIEGTGLGLPIAKHVMEIHGGGITVESKHNSGSTFIVSIPLKTGASIIEPGSTI